MPLPEKSNTDRRSGAIARALVQPQSWLPAIGWTRPDIGLAWERSLAREIDQRRLFPWLSVCFGAGILLSFQAEGQPNLWASLSATGLSGGLVIALRRHFGAMALCAALTMVFAGFSAATLRSRAVAAPVLARLVIAPLTGMVETVEDRGADRRILVRLAHLQGIGEAARPRFVRLTLRKGEDLAAGDFIAARARLLPPPQPAWPGGYDFARDAYYREIGAVGSILGPVRRVASPVAPSWSMRLGASVDGARNRLTRRIADAIGGPAGGVGAALVTGKRGLIPEAANDVLRAAGIYHIVSISGLHMVLAAGTFFWLARAFLCLSPTLSLLWPVKKMAAVVAMIGAIAYCVFSGADVATVRSLLMTLVMFGAILVDRPALSIRNLAIAAILVLAREPEALLGPSFQMSFGAVAALAAFVPGLQWSEFPGRAFSRATAALHWIARQAAGLVTTTLVASIATAPFAAYHFQVLNPYGIIGNALALPLVSLVVMPAAVLGILAFPFGLDGPVWRVMGFAVARVLDVSAWVGSFHGSSVAIAAPGNGVLALLTLGLLIGSICVSSFRLMALAPAMAGLMLAAAPARDDLYVDRTGSGAAIHNRAGDLILVGRTSTFVIEQWLRADGDGRDVASVKAASAQAANGVRCDTEACVVETAERRYVSFVLKPTAFAEDCRRAEIIVTALKAPARCKALLVLDRDALAARGAVSLRLRDDRIELRSVLKGRENVSRDARVVAPADAPAPKRTGIVPEQDLPEEEVPGDIGGPDAPEDIISNGEPG